MNKCLICKGKMKIFAQFEYSTIFQCQICGLGITSNLDFQIDNYHRDEFYIQDRKQFENIYQRRVNLIKSYHKKPGKVLEIGSSAGLMLFQLKNMGWEVLGVEPSKKAAHFSKKLAIPTLLNTFEGAKLPQNTFDVVIINHTLEHLSSPEKVLEKVHKILKSGGLCLIDVPNFGSLSAKIYGSKWPYLLPEEHLWHFTYQALEKLLKKTGFEIIYSEMPSGIWDYGNPLLELWQAFTGLKKRFFNDFLTALPTFFLFKFNLGTSLTILARKVDGK